MKMRLSVKLISLFLLFGLAPLMIVGILLNTQAGQALRDKSFGQLESVRQIRKAQVENYFSERVNDISVLAASHNVQSVMGKSHELFHEIDKKGVKMGSQVWQDALAGPEAQWLDSFSHTYAYYDMFLVDKDGYVVYTVERESDLGENLVHGSLQSSGLGRLYKKVINTNAVALEDFSPYAPSKNRQAAFIGAPVKKGSELLGVVVLQLSTADIDSMMKERAGMGKTGETYLVGKTGDVSAYRSNRETKDGKIGDQKTGRFIKKALSGESGSAIKLGSTGLQELVSYAPLVIPGFNWAVVGTVSVEEAFEAIDSLNQEIWMVGLICIVIVVLVGWFFSRSISQPLLEVINVISSSSSQMAASVTQQERIASQQAAAVNETNTTMEELGASSRQSAEQSEQAAAGADKALELSEFGSSRVGETLESMEQAKVKVEAIAQQILLLSEKTGQIRDITSLVSDFANETKMLAMNAAVEAVRAGEHGKGFSVLAVETRKLADESKRSAGRINALVADIQKATNSTVMATEEGIKTVDEGMTISRNTAETFREVSEAMGSASEGSQQISLNVRQQSVAVRQVVEAMKSVNSGAKEAASGMSQVKEGIRTLNDAAQTLRGMV